MEHHLRIFGGRVDPYSDVVDSGIAVSDDSLGRHGPVECPQAQLDERYPFGWEQTGTQQADVSSRFCAKGLITAYVRLVLPVFSDEGPEGALTAL